MILILLLVLVAAGLAGWFYYSFLRPTEVSLAPGVEVVMGGGGNSLLVRDGQDLMLWTQSFRRFGLVAKRINKEIDLRDPIMVSTHSH